MWLRANLISHLFGGKGAVLPALPEEEGNAKNRQKRN
jgi:hypothetical protein